MSLFCSISWLTSCYITLWRETWFDTSLSTKDSRCAVCDCPLLIYFLRLGFGMCVTMGMVILFRSSLFWHNFPSYLHSSVSETAVHSSEVMCSSSARVNWISRVDFRRATVLDKQCHVRPPREYRKKKLVFLFWDIKEIDANLTSYCDKRYIFTYISGFLCRLGTSHLLNSPQPYNKSLSCVFICLSIWQISNCLPEK